jgi:BirA family transcriptional regulator, biotin operon repressor / biotin---[acetyl-CoA-carboxylase] ligase
VYILSEIEDALLKLGFTGGVHFQPVTGSTNTDARAAALEGAPHGSIWLADAQSAGRGRADHQWESAAGKGLYVSILLRPQLGANLLQWLPLVTGLAAARSIEALTPLAVDLRWPNDLLIGPRKVGGILVESKLSAAVDSPTADFVVVGIGINVHQLVFPQDLSATSLDLELERMAAEKSTSSPHSLHRQQLLLTFLENFSEDVTAIHTEAGRNALVTRLLQSSTWLTGRAVQVHGPQACSGLTAGLDANGMLLVQTESGLKTITTGGIRALNPDE